MQKGICVWFNETKGFGFVTPDDSNNGDIFVHFSSIQGAGFKRLAEGDRVSFETEKTPKGLQAVNVILLDE